MGLGGIIGGAIGGLLGGGDSGSKSATQTTKVEPAPWEDDQKQFWDTWANRFFGVPEKTVISGGSAGVSPSTAYIGTGGSIQDRIKYLEAIQSGQVPAYRPVERDSHPLIKGDYLFNPSWGVQGPGSFGYDGTTLPPQVQLDYANAIQNGLNVEDEIARLKASLDGGTAGTPGTTETIPGQPGLEALMQGQEDWLRGQFGNYEGALTRALRPYQQSITEASTGAIPFSMGGQQLGSLIPQGGMNLAQKMMAANMQVPNARWNFAQQMPINSSKINFINQLGDIAMGLQKMRYGLPSESTSATVPGTGLTGVLQGVTQGVQLGDQIDPWITKLFQ